MKKCLPLILLLTFFTAAKAQYVTIPDDNFRAFLKNKYPVCFNISDQLDTTCVATQRGLLDCSNLNISSLEGIQYFNSLDYLDCSHNLLVNIPKLPDTLVTLICNNNQLTSLPDLPASLYMLNCSYNNLSSLPYIPDYNWARHYTLGSSTREIQCQYNNIYCLPTIKDIKRLSIDSTISCINFINPFDLSMLMSVVSIYGKNGIIDTAYLPGWSPDNTFPICNPTNNINNCTLTSIVKGNVFYDNNKNGVKDPGELDAAYIPINLFNTTQTITNLGGNYGLSTALKGNYNLTITPPNYFISIPSNLPITFSGKDTFITQDFALQAIQSIDSLSIDITPITNRARPGFVYSTLISYKNVGTNNISSNITLNFDATKLSYDSSSDHAVTNNIAALSLSTGILMPGEFKSFITYFKVKPSVLIGDSILSLASITNGVITATDSSKSYVTGSYDPNDKQATPILTPSQVTNGEYISYTIRFQNTGNDTAFNIVIADTLNTRLQPESFVMVNSSHPCNTTFIGNIVYFEFLNILLPDSNINEPMSHGFVTFRVKPLKTVKNNDVIPNKAYIYFDFNAPVITNVAITSIYVSPPVPVRLINFSVNATANNQLLINWLIENELNSKDYEAERSTDGIHFTGIGNVTAQGIKSYSFITAMPLETITYYRLKINDVDGMISYSAIVKVQQQKNKLGLLVMNPIKNNLLTKVTDKQLIGTQALLVNANGQVINKIILQQGLQNTPLGSIASGTYYLQTKKGNIKVLVL